jgi:hypothetical protein
MTMTDNIATIKECLLPPSWRGHANRIWQTTAAIDDLGNRLEQQGRDFIEVMKKDLGAEHLDPGVRWRMVARVVQSAATTMSIIYLLLEL